MRKRLAAVLLLAGALVLWWLYSERKSAPPVWKQPGVAAENLAVSNALSGQNPATIAVIQSNFARVQSSSITLSSATAAVSPAPSGPPQPLEFTTVTPGIVLENVSRAIRQYGAMFGGNPVGTNREITSQLSGNNPKHINFINAEAGMRVNAGGELIDPWGTPYFFHQISGTEMEIHSAGPDRVMWTSDDLVSR